MSHESLKTQMIMFSSSTIHFFNSLNVNTNDVVN